MRNPLELYRERHGWSFAYMARVCGFHRAVVCNHCRGTRGISAESAIKYHRAFGIQLSELRPDLWPPEEAPQSESTDAGA